MSPAALSPIQKELYDFAVRQVKARGIHARSLRSPLNIWRLLFGSRELTPYDLHHRPEPVLRRVKRLERFAAGKGTR